MTEAGSARIRARVLFMSLRWSDVRTLYLRELRSALRDRTIVVNSVVVPLVLYPLILWGLFTGIAFVRGQTDDMAARLTLVGGAAAPELVTHLDRNPGLRLLGGEPDRLRGEARLRAGDVDAVIVVEPDAAGSASGWRVLVVFDGSNERSDHARRRVAEALGQHRQSLLRQEALAREIDPARWAGFGLAQRNMASRREMGAFLLGLILPIFFIVMVALGCLNPAIDTIAGERERGTWETLMTTAVSRAGIVVAKFLAVSTLGGMAGMLNVVAMLLTMRGVLAPLTGGGSDALEFSLAPAAIPVLVACAVLLAGLLAAGMMALVSFARTFREGQSLVMPLYLAAVLPAMFLGTPGIRLTPGTALIPVVNVALAARDAIAATFRPLEMAVAAVATVAVIALFLRIALVVLSSEESIAGSHAGSLFTFLRSRRRARAVTPTPWRLPRP